MADHREVLYTIDKSGKRKWLYPTWFRGFYVTRRAAVAAFLVLFYLSLPWVTFGGKQAVLLDIYNRQFTFFGTTLWATDTLLLALTLAGLCIALFFFTSVLGRVWCGWACPETVFLEFVFRPIERLIEGGPAQRLRLDKGPWTLEKIFKKFLKHSFCAVMAWVLASTALAYFYGREPLLQMMTDLPWEHPRPFLMTVALMGLMAFQFGWFREQFCTVLCPYARFQSVLMDTHSYGVGYDQKRGEPRGKVSDPEAGDCIDCGLCVRVCPTGIDIRNGNQLECIHCAACVDACDSIMDKVGRSQGLIRYDTEHTLLTGEKTKRFTPRTMVYGIILVAVSALFLVTLYSRTDSEVKVVRGSGDAPYTRISETKISNHLSIRLSNRGEEQREFLFSSDDPRFAVIVPSQPFPVGAGEIKTAPLFVQFEEELLVNGRAQFSLMVKDNADYEETFIVRLLGPG